MLNFIMFLIDCWSKMSALPPKTCAASEQKAPHEFAKASPWPPASLARPSLSFRFLFGRLEPSWVTFCRSWGSLGRSWALLGRSWAPLGPLLGALGRLLGGSWGALGRSWGDLGKTSKNQ